MAQIDAKIRLRPTRIGFLIRPNDRAALRKILLSGPCVWGGALNPIIPVSRTTPKAWSRVPRTETSALDVARGYVDFFEPDVFVPAQSGLLAQIGLSDLVARHILHPEAKPLDDFLTPAEGLEWSEPAFGLPIIDVLRAQYVNEQKFVLRHPQPALLVKPQRGSLAAEAIFGVYPSGSANAHFERGYRDVFDPEIVECGPEAWLKVFVEGATTPLQVTAHKLEKRRYWYHEPIVFVFDPSNPLDVIDLWNLRLEPSPILPVPIAWVDALAPKLRELFVNDYRPLRGNRHGAMHRTTVEFGRSMTEAGRDTATAVLTVDVPPDAVTFKHWRTEIWRLPRDRQIRGPERLLVTAAESSSSVPIREGSERTAALPGLQPAFAGKTAGRASARWVNVVQLGSYGHHDIGLTIPFNSFHRETPRLDYVGGERAVVGSEGWAFKRRYDFGDLSVRLPEMDQIIADSLKLHGIKARISEPGRIGKQMLQRLDGLGGVRLLRDAGTLQLLNQMAGSQRRRGAADDMVEETFPGRTASLGDWQALAKRRSKGLDQAEIEQFTRRDVIRLGLESRCPHCDARNWSGLDAVDYSLTCERCLNTYDFPQGKVARNNETFRYRVVGPFAVPDYGRGSYSTLLALDLIRNLGGSHDYGMTFSAGCLLELEGRSLEADFIALRGDRNLSETHPPRMIIGECKSFGAGPLIKADDLEKLKVLAARLPGTVIIIAVLKETFLPEEVARLRRFVSWARRPDADDRPTNPVVVLTGHELFAGDMFYNTWKTLGGRHAKYADFQFTQDLDALAEATQAIYLDMPSYWDWLDANRKTPR